MTDLERIACLNALQDLRQARTRHERGIVVKRLADTMGVTVRTAYRRLEKLGWKTGRSERRDKGSSRVSEDGLVEIATMVAQARNKRGQPNLPVKEAHRVAQELGLEAAGLSYRQLQRRLNQKGLGLRHMRAPEASITRVSCHPNHVWQLDASQAVQWYFRDPSTGKKLDLYPDAGARFYKLEHVKKVRKTIHRYVVTDHTSGCYFVRYYYVGGERPEDVIDCLFRAMAPKGLNGAYPFRGVPRHIVFDLGPANKSALVTNLLDELGITYEFHKPKNAKASGSVETRHNHWQRSFEGRLAQRFAEDLDQLNHLALHSCALFNADERRRHSRHGLPPMEAWLRITAKQLVECPGRDTFFQLATTTKKVATLDNRHHLRADSRRWEIRGENVHGRQKVTFRLAPFSESGIRVWDEWGRELAATEIFVDANGFALNGRRHVWHDDDAPGATAPPTAAQRISKTVEDGEARKTLPVFDDLEDRVRRQTYLARQGREWAPQDTPVAADPVLGSLDAREEIFRRLGRPLIGEVGRWWLERIGDGITVRGLEAAWLEFQQLDQVGTTDTRNEHATG